MKIIKQGKLPTAQAKCQYCGCEFEFDITDVDLHIGSYTGCPESPATVRCPQCKNEILVKDKLNLIDFRY